MMGVSPLARCGSAPMSPLRLVLTVPFWLLAAAARAEEPRTDLYGDSLPAFAVLRLGSTRLRHAERVNTLAVSPDGTLIATGSHDHTVRFWDAVSGRQVRRFQGQNNFVPMVTF